MMRKSFCSLLLFLVTMSPAWGQQTVAPEAASDSVKTEKTDRPKAKKAHAAKQAQANRKNSAAKKNNPPPRPEPTVANFAYGDQSDRQVFDFWQAKSDQPTPVLVYIHGGGWSGGDKTSYGTRQIQSMLDSGISVAAINYRLIHQANEQGVKPPVKACLHDAARAIQTIRSKAEQWNLDPTRVAASGGSAGACTSLWLAFHDDLADPDSDDPIARQSTRLTCAAVSGAQTSLDPHQVRQWIPNARYGGHAFGFASFNEAFEKRDSVMPLIQEYSPIELVTKDDPPIFLDYSGYGLEPVIGQEQPDPTHSALYGVKLLERLNQVGVEGHLSYKLKPDSEYRSIEDFVKRKLKP